MIYNIITFKDGTKQKLADGYTEQQIREMCKVKGLEVESIERMGLVDNLDYLSNKSKKELHYKVIWGFDEERSTDIGESELIKALYAMSTKSKVYLGDILLDGKYIIAIKENYQKTMGWNPTHEMDSDDWNQLKTEGIDKLFAGKVYEAKQKVQDMIASKDLSLLRSETKQLN